VNGEPARGTAEAFQMATQGAHRHYGDNLTASSEQMHGVPTCRFAIHKVDRDRVSVRAEYVFSGQKKRSYVLLPAYPTGYPDDAPCNNVNVVLDPVDFVDVDSCAERDVFAPVLGQEMLAYYEKMHPHAGLTVSRCC